MVVAVRVVAIGEDSVEEGAVVAATTVMVRREYKNKKVSWIVKHFLLHFSLYLPIRLLLFKQKN